MTGTCPRCKVDREFTELPGGLLRCSWCTLIVRRYEPTTTVTRLRNRQREWLAELREGPPEVALEPPTSLESRR